MVVAELGGLVKDWLFPPPMITGPDGKPRLYYDPEVYWRGRARDLIRTYDHPETWPSLGWMRAGVEEQIVPDLLRDAASQTVLVPGAGSGRQYRYLLEAGFSPAGFDIAPRLVSTCRKRFPNVLTWQGTVEGSASHSEPTDAVFTSAVLQHVEPVRIGRAVEALKSLAGKIVIMRELTRVETESHYMFVHDYEELFSDWRLVKRVVTDDDPLFTVELFAYAPAA